MNKIAIGIMFLLGAVVLVTPALATDVVCASPQELNMGTGPTNGCIYDLANYLNFSVNGPTGTGDATWPVPSAGQSANIEFTASGTPIYTLDFQTTGQNPAPGSPCSVANTWCTPSGSGGASQTFDYDAQTTSATFLGLSLTDGTVTNAQRQNGSTISTLEQFCLGDATFDCANGAANYGYLQIVDTYNHSATAPFFTTVFTVCTPSGIATVDCTTSNPGSASISFAAVTKIGIQDTVAIAPDAENLTLFIDSFDNTFTTAAATPEPSTMVLLGAALGAVGLLRFRGRRRA